MRTLAALLAAAALLLSGCGGASSAEDSSGSGESAASAASASKAAPLDFTATTVSGEGFEGASLSGTPTVMWFWAPWCPTCLQQVPVMDELATQYAGTVSFVGVGSLDSGSEIADFADDVSPDVVQLTDPDGTVWTHFGVTAQSTFVLLDAAGERIGSGYLDDDDLTDMVAKMAS